MRRITTTRQERSRATALALLALGLVLLVTLGTSAGRSGEEGAVEVPRGPEEREKAPSRTDPLAMPESLVDILVTFGAPDEEPRRWQGRVEVAKGRLLRMEVAEGAPRSTVEGNRFDLRPRRRRPARGMLRLELDAPATAEVKLATDRGELTVVIGDLPPGEPRWFLDGQVAMERLGGALRLTGAGTEDDFPALAAAPGGSLWLAYVEYHPSPPLAEERILAGDFDSLVPEGHGDTIRLIQFDGKVWRPPEAVTEGRLDGWRPAVAVDGEGTVWVFWSQRVEGDWEIFARRARAEKPGEGLSWAPPVRLTHEPGADFHLSAVTDAAGKVWIAWQASRGGQFDIQLATAGPGGLEDRSRIVPRTAANEWSPALAAGLKGEVYLAWDTYERGNYDVRLLVLGPRPQALAVASSPRFEARPQLACDREGRLWIAYEEGDEEWGKDYSTAEFRRIGFDRNPGYALYVRRTVRVKCLADGRLRQPAASLEEALAGTLGRNRSLPRPAAGPRGDLWLLLRHHTLPGGGGEAWRSYALRYDGKGWSPPRALPSSSNLLDNRPALAPLGEGVLAVYSSDRRTRTADRHEDDLYAHVLEASGPVSPPELTDCEPEPEPQVAAVHPAEGGDVARLRAFRLDAGGKTLRLLRGEFHRHTEYTAHRDQDGSLEDSWRYALDAARLDWMGNGDHDNGAGKEYMWWQIQKVTDLFHDPPRFVAAQTYERSVRYPDGHRNVMMPRRGIRPLPRGDLKESTPETGTPDTKLLYAYLRRFGGLCAEHTSATNMGTDWRDNDPLVEPVVEIYQGHRHNYEHSGAPRSATQETQIGGYRPAGYVWNALARGYRLGFQSSSDHVSTHMSYAVVLAEEASREGLVAAFRKRHCYAATDNILLVVRSGDHVMGDAFETEKLPILEIRAHGTAPIASVHVVRDNRYVYTTEPGTPEVFFSYTDVEARPGGTSYYYVRVEQSDGNLAWASPLWITYRGEPRRF